MIFSRFLKEKSIGKKLAYIGVFAALSIVTQMFLEFKMFDVQFSITILVSCLCGIVLGPIAGFGCCILGDLVGFIVNFGGGMYMFWIGLSTGMFAFISGIVFNYIKIQGKFGLLIKLLIITISTFLICTIGINSTGFYIYNKGMGFSTAVLDYVSKAFGSESVSFFGYVVYRLIFKGQIFNSIFNYALMFILIPVVNIKFSYLFGSND